MGRANGSGRQLLSFDIYLLGIRIHRLASDADRLLCDRQRSLRLLHSPRFVHEKDSPQGGSDQLPLLQPDRQPHLSGDHTGSGGRDLGDFRIPEHLSGRRRHRFDRCSLFPESKSNSPGLNFENLLQFTLVN